MRKRRIKSDKIDLTEKKYVKKSKMSKILQKLDKDVDEINHEESIEIIKLTEDNDEDEESADNDSDWVDVPDLPKTNGVIINFGNIDTLNNINDEKRKQQRNDREYALLKDRTMLMCLIARAMYINKICNQDLVQNLAFSLFPHSFIKGSVSRLDYMQKIVHEIKNNFVIIDEFSEKGDVSNILTKGFEERKLFSSWVNVALVSMLRSAGFRARLIAILYPQKIDKVPLLCKPTIYRPSTRGNNSRTSKKQLIRLSNDQSSSIIFIAEVLDEENYRWIPIDLKNISSFDMVPSIVQDYPRFLYVISIDNDGYVKDISPRYDSQWAESSRRSRLSQQSWEKILNLLAPSTLTDLDKLEDNSIKSEILSRGIPNTIANLKGHPFFVLQKHLLKYEVIYPSESLPFGQFNDEDVYLRDHVKVAHTRETWLKEAMVVKNGEIPCKRVKTMMATRKQKTHGTDPFVDIFGPWQIEKFKPPKAENGIVPVNDHGNVYLFKPDMIPEGCLHIRISGIDKVAKRLQIDCAPAMVGWGFVKCQRVVPILDGWIICKEHIKVLMDALREWKNFEASKRAIERQKNVIKKWEILTRRILLKERLRREYNF